MDCSPSMEFPRQEYWSGLPFISPGNFQDSGIELESPALAGRFFTTEPPAKPKNSYLPPCWKIARDGVMVWPVWENSLPVPQKVKDPAIPTPSNLALENNWHSLWEKNVYHSILITSITILEPIIQGEVSQKEKNKYCILTHIYGLLWWLRW